MDFKEVYRVINIFGIYAAVAFVSLLNLVETNS
jgi:hypothetical protein